ncbi:MAG TPA: cytochrome c [Verrucomicrobiae bacterium]|nr:cytochrome c [Verrucomicrobiae bacterium]
MMRGALFGVLGTLVVLAVLGYLGIANGWMPANADAKPSSLERWAANTSLHATLRREAPRSANPLPLTDANLLAGVKLYAQNCAVCHGAADGTPTNVAHGLYQKPPQLATDGVEDDPDGVTYWKIAHGIRLTGMPAFGGTLDRTQLWELALFLKHMDALPPLPQRAWKAMKS